MLLHVCRTKHCQFQWRSHSGHTVTLTKMWNLTWAVYVGTQPGFSVISCFYWQSHKEYNSFLVLEMMLKLKVEWRWKAVSVLKSVIKKTAATATNNKLKSEMIKPHYAHTTMATHKKCLGDIILVYNENGMKSFYSSKHSELATCYILYVEPRLITSWHAAV